METIIKQVQDYFISKILNSDFEIIKFCEHHLTIKIDNSYEFVIWMSSTAMFREPWNASGNCFIKLEFTEEQKVKCDEILMPRYTEYLRAELLSAKERELELLRAEILKLESNAD